MANEGKTYRPCDRMTATLTLDEPVSRVRLVSSTRAIALEKMGIKTVRDLVNHYPRRYVDLSSVRDIASSQIGEMCTVSGEVFAIELKRPRPNLSLVEITLVDNTGILIITCFNQPWLLNQLSQGDKIAVAGKIVYNFGFKRMTNPYIEALSNKDVTGMIIPVHPACEKISVALMRRLVNNALIATRGLFDPMPLSLRMKYRLMSRQNALFCIHFPASMDEEKQARRRLVYEELLFLELFLMQENMRRSEGLEAHRHICDGEHLRAFESAIPFELSDEQICARDDLLGVLAAPRVGNHMILGDVGTGKTIVCAHAFAVAADSGTQAALLAPTEVLARQHADTLSPLLDAAGISSAVLTGSTSAFERSSILDRLADGSLDVLIGTHAILEDDVVFANLSVAIVDEQQRFGVEQRARLLMKGKAVDAIALTATPIPRTLALALYGDVSLSYLKHRPFNTAARETHVLSKKEQGRAYDAALDALARSEQVYVVCPLIGVASTKNDSDDEAQEEDEEFHPLISIESEYDFPQGDVAAATKEAKFLQNKVFVDYRVELLHGGMPAEEKHAVMERFRSGQTQVLVTTTVIEVGVDVPLATVMIVEDADRFGLAQLHQLRGRVGRADLPSQVFLISSSKQDQAIRRLRALESTDDGYELAKFDLSLRREGDILGNRQSGMSSLKLVNVMRDERIIEAAHADAIEILSADPHLETPEYAALGREISLTFMSENSNVTA